MNWIFIALLIPLSYIILKNTKSIVFPNKKEKEERRLKQYERDEERRNKINKELSIKAENEKYAKLQSYCLHEKKYLKSTANYNIKFVCDVCRKELDSPNIDEITYNKNIDLIDYILFFLDRIDDNSKLKLLSAVFNKQELFVSKMKKIDFEELLDVISDRYDLFKFNLIRKYFLKFRINMLFYFIFCFWWAITALPVTIILTGLFGNIGPERSGYGWFGVIPSFIYVFAITNMKPKWYSYEEDEKIKSYIRIKTKSKFSKINPLPFTDVVSEIINNYKNQKSKTLNKKKKEVIPVKQDIEKPILKEKKEVKKDTPTNITSLSDNLIKLGELKDKGLLTEEEFNEQKKKLLKQ